MIYHKFSHGTAFYTLNGKNVNVMSEWNVNHNTFQWFTIGILSKYTKNVNIQIYTQEMKCFLTSNKVSKISEMFTASSGFVWGQTKTLNFLLNSATC